MGHAGIHVIFGVTSAGKLVDDKVTVIPSGADHVAYIDAAWDRLDAVDPMASVEAVVRRKRVRIVH